MNTRTTKILYRIITALFAFALSADAIAGITALPGSILLIRNRFDALKKRAFVCLTFCWTAFYGPRTGISRNTHSPIPFN